MRLLDRYLLRELLVPLAYCLCGLLMLCIFADLSKEFGSFTEKGLRFQEVAEYYLVVTPEFVVLVLPIALLLALLYTLTSLARHNEITAIRAAGVSLWRMCLPYLAVGFAASLVLFALNELWVPNSGELAEQIKNRQAHGLVGAQARSQVRDLGFVNARDRRTWQFGAYNPATGAMTNLVVLWTLSDGSSRWLKADRALRLNGIWTLYNLKEYRGDPHANSLLVPLLQTNALAFPEFSETLEEINSDIKLTYSASLKNAKRADIPIVEILSYLRLHPNPSRSDRDSLYTKLYGRLAAPWTCLVVVLIAIPFGAGSGRRNVFVGVASSILICFIYFVLQQLGLACGASGRVPAWLAAWFPNLSFGLTGLWLTARVR